MAKHRADKLLMAFTAYNNVSLYKHQRKSIKISIMQYKSPFYSILILEDYYLFPLHKIICLIKLYQKKELLCI